MGKPIRYYPLSNGFMLVAILGFIITMIYSDHFGATWGFTLALFFVIMFISSLITMTRAPLRDEHIEALTPHLAKKRKATKKKTANKKK